MPGWPSRNPLSAPAKPLYSPAKVTGGGRGKHFDVDDDDDELTKAAPGKKRRLTEFECPTCSAHNPVGDAFGNGDDVFCGYCGQSFVALIDEDGALRLKET